MAERPRVTVVGLGPAGTDLLSQRAVTVLTDAAAAGRAWLRTARHPAAVRVEGVPSFDQLYETAATFEEVYGAVVDALVEAAVAAAPDPVVYAVPGSPLIAERTVDLLRGDVRVDVQTLPALSFLDLAWAALGVDPLAAGVRLLDAGEVGPALAGGSGPLLVGQCWSRQVLSDVKLAWPDEAGTEPPRPVMLHHLGLEDELVRAVDWWELDRTLEPDHLTSLYVPAWGVGIGGGAGVAGEGDDVGGSVGAGVQMTALVELMDTLRAACPWDSVQTHASLMPHLVEESYEVLDALDALGGGGSDSDSDSDNDSEAAPSDEAYAHLEEELGDLLFQIVFHACLADEEGRFDFADVARGVHDKLVHRHPHVFGDVDAATPDQVVTNWEAIKKQEKGRRSVTEGIPAGLPALMLTTKLARKARGVGVEPEDVSAGADTGLDAAATMLAALSRRAAAADPKADDPLEGDGGATQEAVGALLYDIATLAQRLGVDAEQALRARALVLRAAILEAEGVPKGEEGNR